MKKTSAIPPFAALLVLMLLPMASACKKAAPEGETVATINGAPVLLKDFENEVARASRMDPSLELTPETLEKALHTLIDRKLMIQEAVKAGLSKDERFLEAVKEHWEQTLIRLLIDSKAREWSARLYAAEDEIRLYHGRMASRVTVETLEVPNEDAALIAREQAAAGKGLPGARMRGPLLVENVGMDDPLYGAFDMKEGETAAIRTGGGYLVVHVIGKEAVKTPPLADARAQIKAHLIEEKKRAALDAWLEGIKRSARVEIDAGALKKAGDGR